MTEPLLWESSLLNPRHAPLQSVNKINCAWWILTELIVLLTATTNPPVRPSVHSSMYEGEMETMKNIRKADSKKFDHRNLG